MTISSWLHDNALAAYGALVGTVALLLNVARYVYDRRKDAIRLSVTCKPDPKLDENVRQVNSERQHSWDGPDLMPGFQIKVTNRGAMLAHVVAVGVVYGDGLVESALVGASGSPNILQSVSEGALEPLPAKASRTFTVYVRRGKELVPKSAYVEDGTGRRWTTKC